MHEIIYTVAPHPAPGIGLEDDFQDRGWIKLSVKSDDLAIAKKRELRIIRDVSIIAEFYSAMLGPTNACKGFVLGRHADACRFLDESLDRFDLVHGSQTPPGVGADISER